MHAVSTHAPRVGGDMADTDTLEHQTIVSTHAPRVGGDSSSRRSARSWGSFNPRPPRGGRRAGATCGGPRSCFNPRPPRGGRPSTSMACPVLHGNMFQPTPPAWGATCGGVQDHRRRRVSTHAPRVGGDVMEQLSSVSLPVFQPTPPAWGATREEQGEAAVATCFNPRPPRGGRRSVFRTAPRRWGFNPRPPRGGRLADDNDG